VVVPIAKFIAMVARLIGWVLGSRSSVLEIT
jgi:hypothetical protein